jgi:hypothetical protein
MHYVAISAENRAHLIGHDHGPVEVGRSVIKIVGEHFLPGFPRGLAPVVDKEALVHLAALFRDLGFDAIDVIANIHAIGDGALMVVFRDAVLMEVGNGLWRGRGSEADKRSVEVFQHLSPEIVDRAMAFVRYNEVKFLNGDGRIVSDVASTRAEGYRDFRAGHVISALREFFATQD